MEKLQSQVCMLADESSTALGPGNAGSTDMDLEPPKTCPLCGGHPELWVPHLPTAIAGGSVDAYRCQACNSVFSWPLVVPTGLYDAIYRNASRLVGYTRYARYAESSQRAEDPLRHLARQEDVYWAVTEVLAARPESKSWHIVEVGSGLGYLTAALNTAGYDVTGLDISAEAVAEARGRFGPHYERHDIFEPDERFVGTFDFAILLETIEHVPDPSSFLGAVTRLLKPNGSVLVTTPNRDAHPRGAQWRTDPPPVHLFWLTEFGLEQLASRVGYRTELVDFTAFNAEHRQTVALGDLTTTPPPMLGPTLEPCGTIPPRTQLMERLREFPPLAAVARFIYDGVRPNRARLTDRSFSIAAVLSPNGSRPAQDADTASG